MILFAPFLLLAAHAAAPAATHSASPADTAKIVAVLTRTKTTRKTYAVYYWNTLTPPGGPPREEWSAEFNSGRLHRVETPRMRVVADCQAGTGFAVDMLTGEATEGAGVARVACGIATHRAFLWAEWKGRVTTRFGPADRIRVADEGDVRQYDVSPDGIILASIYSRNLPGEPVSLVCDPVDVETRLPGSDIFDRTSLARSYVPDRYKRRPARKE